MSNEHRVIFRVLLKEIVLLRIPVDTFLAIGLELGPRLPWHYVIFVVLHLHEDFPCLVAGHYEANVRCHRHIRADDSGLVERREAEERHQVHDYGVMTESEADHGLWRCDILFSHIEQILERVLCENYIFRNERASIVAEFLVLDPEYFCYLIICQHTIPEGISTSCAIEMRCVIEHLLSESMGIRARHRCLRLCEDTLEKRLRIVVFLEVIGNREGEGSVLILDYIQKGAAIVGLYIQAAFIESELVQKGVHAHKATRSV